MSRWEDLEPEDLYLGLKDLEGLEELYNGPDPFEDDYRQLKREANLYNAWALDSGFCLNKRN